MFEKVSKYFASKATSGAVDGVKETLNDKIDKYGDILNFGLVLSVIILGGHFVSKRDRRRSQNYVPSYIPENGAPPVIINNYYQDAYQSYPVYQRREEKQRYHGNNYIQRAQPGAQKPPCKKR